MKDNKNKDLEPGLEGYIPTWKNSNNSKSTVDEKNKCIKGYSPKESTSTPNEKPKIKTGIKLFPKG